MKMVRRVVARDSGKRIEITIKLTNSPHSLTRDECARQANSVQEKVAQVLVNGEARFAGFYLRNVRCS